MPEFRVRFDVKEIMDLVVQAESVDYVSDEGMAFYVFSNDDKNPIGSNTQAIVNSEHVLHITRLPELKLAFGEQGS